MAPPGSYDHTAFVVPDLAVAAQQFAGILGVSWSDPRAVELGDVTLRVMLTRGGGVPYLELIETVPDSPFEALGAVRLHHFGTHTDDLDGHCAELVAGGLAIEFDGRLLGRRFAVLRSPQSGVGIELISSASPLPQ